MHDRMLTIEVNQKQMQILKNAFDNYLEGEDFLFDRSSQYKDDAIRLYENIREALLNIDNPKTEKEIISLIPTKKMRGINQIQ